MPHIYVKYSAAFSPSIDTLLPALHESLCADETVKPPTVKTLGTLIDSGVVGDESTPDEMILLQLRMKPGRNLERRKSLSQALHDVCAAHINEHKLSATISVEIVQLEAESYVSSHITQ